MLIDNKMLTTKDNPYNPFTNFQDWYSFDVIKGHNTSSYIDRVTQTSDDISDADNDVANQTAIDEIIFFDVLGIYEKVESSDFNGSYREVKTIDEIVSSLPSKV